jgi:hypothetical protein
MTWARRPSIAACSTVFLARSTGNSGSGAASVVVAVHDVGAPVHRRPRRHGLGIGERLEDGLRRGVDHDLPRSPYRI